MNRIAIFLLLAMAISIGCNTKTTATNSAVFHIDVTNDPSNNEDLCETVLSFHPPSESEVIVRTASSESIVSFDAKNPNSDMPTIVRLSVERGKSSDGSKTEFTTLLQPQTPNGAYAGGPSTQVVNGDVTASEYLIITVDDGDFPVNKPIELGTLNGVPVTLTVQTR